MSMEDFKAGAKEGFQNYHGALTVLIVAALACGYQMLLSPDAMVVREQNKNTEATAIPEIPETPEPTTPEEKGWIQGAQDWIGGLFDGGEDEIIGTPIPQEYPEEGDSATASRTQEDSLVSDDTVLYEDVPQCVAINTGRWGNPETVDPTKPIVDTPNEAIALLPDAQTGRIYVRQGNQVRLYVSSDVFANGSCFFAEE